jgi:hypothetical protein
MQTVTLKYFPEKVDTSSGIYKNMTFLLVQTSACYNAASVNSNVFLCVAGQIFQYNCICCALHLTYKSYGQNATPNG